jgi:hypothetical protein
MDQEVVCGHRWYASRVEVETPPVLHVCGEPAAMDRHAVGPGLVRRLHRCACGAVLVGDASTSSPPGPGVGRQPPPWLR